MMRAAKPLTAGVMAGMLAIAGCSGSSPVRTPQQLTKVTYLTGFALLGQDAYLYLATEKGYFRDAGIELDIRPGKGTATNLKLMLAGQAGFATVDLTGALIEYGKNTLRGFTTVAAVYQRTVSSITSLAGAGITAPKDLEGKTIGYQPGGVNYTLFPTYAKLAGVNPNAVRWQPVDPAQLRAVLAAGKVDAITETVIGTPGVRAVAQGRDVVTLPYSDLLGDLYGNVIVTTTGTAENNADLVRRFRQAALRGLSYAIDHPQEAGRVFAELNKGYPAAAAEAENRLMLPYVRPPGAAPVGSLDPARVARSIAILQGAGAIPAGIQPEHVVAFQYADAASPGGRR
jgi:NitT/TauT family transport system substrate-binding protein